ncbi:DUF72 domain-containing protein [Metallosphaera tengchongensis]|uniref:DUF72 domain-containing protein n=1 Tax=Metallosphaera tengchongensis TaxID=1532350 RepID=A0A6N0NRF0_9CREN|nr:DUF72 domain-containing protein [Metallosphaera tengchongensis]QKQ99453.1 DUF72 domain-containing protein [Metallosphaera tengchongensis]
MEIYVGTSGWSYSWNKGRNLSWYEENTGFNAVELNFSFYRVPTKRQVDEWKQHKIRWSIKVHRSITHVERLSSLDAWHQFKESVEGLNPDFYLFQLPPSFKLNQENMDRVIKFEHEVGRKMAIEFRDTEWYKANLHLESTQVSIDSPIGVIIAMSSDTVYLRMHGRGDWYLYNYRDEDLREDVMKIVELSPKRVYVFFNNDQWMLENGRKMMEILKHYA